MVLGLLVHETPSDFFRRMLRSEALVYKYIFFFFSTAVLRKLFDIRFSQTITVISLLVKMASKTVTRCIDSQVSWLTVKYIGGNLMVREIRTNH